MYLVKVSASFTWTIKKIGKPGNEASFYSHSLVLAMSLVCLKLLFRHSSCTSFAVAMFRFAILNFVYRGYGFAYDQS